MTRTRRVKRKRGTVRRPKSRTLELHFERREPVTWAYGMTTVPSRLESGLMEQSLDSLKNGGFDKPRLFIDGVNSPESYERFDLDCTCRYPRIGNYENWMLSMWELYTRNPVADRYAMFEDDILMSRNTRQYLEHCWYPEKGYLNLFSSLPNEGIGATIDVKSAIQSTGIPWYEADQTGRGSLALIFNREAVQLLLLHPHRIEPLPPGHPLHKSNDYTIAVSMNSHGFKEYARRPSLVQHVGLKSTIIDAPRWCTSESFRGVDFDAMELFQ